MVDHVDLVLLDPNVSFIPVNLKSTIVKLNGSRIFGFFQGYYIKISVLVLLFILLCSVFSSRVLTPHFSFFPFENPRFELNSVRILIIVEMLHRSHLY